MSRLKKAILSGLLLATTLVLSRFLSIKTPIVVISFSFVPIMLSAIVMGPVYAMLVSGLADLIGALLFPFGAYFVGYTISSVLLGLIYGIFLHKKQNGKNVIFAKKQLLLRLIISCTLSLVLISGGLNTLWISITTGKAFFVIATTRILKELILLPIQVGLIYFIYQYLPLKQIFAERRESDDID